MLNFTPEQLEAVKAAKSAEELIEIAKKENIELTQEQAENFLQPPVGEISEEELENVSGGGCGTSSEYSQWEKEAKKDGRINYAHWRPCECGTVSSDGRYSRFFRSSTPRKPLFFYNGIKCYACGRERDEYYNEMTGGYHYSN